MAEERATADAPASPAAPAAPASPASPPLEASPAAAPPPPSAAAAAVPGGSAAPGDSAAPAPDLAELSARAAERDEYLALAQRARADFENYRKRVARDAAAAELRAVGRLVRELLPAVDSLERAVAAADGTDAGASRLVDGMRLVRDDLLGALGRAGVEAYTPQGERFDPEQHEAIAQHPVDGAEPGTVVEVYQAGYRLGGSLIRPARVVVAGAPAPAPAAAEPAGGGG